MGLSNLFKVKTIKEKYYNYLFKQVKGRKMPQHVAIIMDGNGRWAKQYGLSRSEGHRQGVKVLKDIFSSATDLGISYLTLYAFSSENWKRPKEEVDTLMSLLVEFFESEIYELNRNQVKIYVFGDLSMIPLDAEKAVINAMNLTQENTGLHVNIAINYGGRMEILKAVKEITDEVQNGDLNIPQINYNIIESHLYTKGMPDPDLLIRTGGEYRLSNFLLYQMAYTELLFTDKKLLWPDFSRIDLLKAIKNYQSRTRKYGGIKEGKGD